MKVFGIILILLVTFLGGCLKKTVTRTYTVDVPYYEEVEGFEEVKTSKTVEFDKYYISAPYFPLSDGVMKIAILPFTSSSGGHNKGVEAAEEIEFELIKRAQYYQSEDETELFMRVKKYFDGNYSGISENDINIWMKNNKQKKYEIINRTLIGEVLMESEMKNLTTSSINKTKDVLGVNVLITGHVRTSDSSNISFIMKAIDTRTSKVAFTERYEGGYTDAITRAVDSFYFNIAKSPEKGERIITETKKVPFKRKVKKSRQEMRTSTEKMCRSQDGTFRWVRCNDKRAMYGGY